MEQYFVYILLCIIQRLSVNGQMLVSHNDGVVITSNSQHISDDNNEDFTISNIIDGNKETDANKCNCCGATDLDDNPWFKVDLLQEYAIQRIHVLGRTDYGQTLYTMEIQLGTTESDGTILQNVDTSKTSLHELNFTLTPPQPARYITLTLRRKMYFVICELYVYAVCNLGTYGMDCLNTCGNCEDSTTCNNVDGNCTACVNGYSSPMCKVCIDGRYGTTCNETCSQCNNTNVCDKSNGDCPSGCSAGYQGTTCKEVCNWGTYGTDCLNTCGNCEDNATCNNVDGTCTACVNGYSSPMCKECVDGRFGVNCNGTCGQCYNSVACVKTNATCPDGCSAGFQGITCKEECEDGTFGPGCEEKCGNCFNGLPCNNIDGSCASCAAGYKGNTCHNICQAGIYGFNCKQRCGICKDGDVCDIYTGECPNGCTDEYKGSQCLQEIDQDTCISLPVFIGSLFAVIVVTVTIVTVLCWLFYRKRLNKKTHKPANNEDTSIPYPNTPSTYDTLRFENQGGESTYTDLNRRS